MPDLENFSNNFKKIDANNLEITYVETKTNLLKTLETLNDRKNKELLKIAQKFNPKIDRIQEKINILNKKEEISKE